MATSASHQILALGSPHGDDQVAWRVADKLSNDPALSDCVHKLTSPYELVGHFRTDLPAIVIDACHSGQPPGSVFRIDGDRLHELPAISSSTHGGTVADAIRLADALQCKPLPLVVLAVEIESSRPNQPLTATAYQSIDELEQHVRAEVARMERTEAHIRNQTHG